MRTTRIFYVLFFLCACGCFSQTSYGDLEVYGGIPFINEVLNNGGKETFKTEMPSYSFGIGAANYALFSKPALGLSFFGNFLFPKTFIHDRGGEESRYKRDIFALSLQLGLVYRLIDNGRFKVPVTFGLHYFTMSGEGTVSSTASTDLAKNAFGLGASIGAEFHANEKIYFFGRLQGAFDFITITKWSRYEAVLVSGKLAYFIKSNSYASLSAHTELLPVIGIGLNMDGIF